MKDWIKQLRIELGRKEGRAKVTQSELAELVGLGLSAVGKWEMGKRPQKPERDSYVKLFHLASPQLRAKAPHDLTEVNGGEGHASEHPVDSAEGAGESGLMLSKLEHALIENFRQLSGDEQTDVAADVKKRARASQPPAALKSKA